MKYIYVYIGLEKLGLIAAKESRFWLLRICGRETEATASNPKQIQTYKHASRNSSYLRELPTTVKTEDGSRKCVRERLVCIWGWNLVFRENNTLRIGRGQSGKTPCLLVHIKCAEKGGLDFFFCESHGNSIVPSKLAYCARSDVLIMMKRMTLYHNKVFGAMGCDTLLYTRQIFLEALQMEMLCF